MLVLRWIAFKVQVEAFIEILYVNHNINALREHETESFYLDPFGIEYSY